MDGYFDQPDATADALRDGWYHTGDLGAIDDEGYLSIVGRARDVIRTGGETVAPGEVEAALATHPSVAEVAVVGLPDQRGARSCARWSSRGQARTTPSTSTSSAHTPPARSRASSNRGDSRSSTSCRARRRPARCSAPCSSSASSAAASPSFSEAKRSQSEPFAAENARRYPSPSASRRSRSRRANFWTLPDGVRGNSSIARNSSGHFWRARPAASSWARTASRVGQPPRRAAGARTRSACSPSRTSGAATTATSATPGKRRTKLLDLERRDVLAAADDDVLLAVDDREIAVVVEHADVAGRVPPVGVEALLRERGSV